MKAEKKKILIVEDELSLLEMYKARFDKGGYFALGAADGESGIEIAKKEKPDLILLDLLLPRISGIDFIQAIRDDATIQKTPILVFSNFDHQEQINQALRLGANDYVIKTDVTPTELLEKVERMLLLKKGKKQEKRILIIEESRELTKAYRAELAELGFMIEISDKGLRGLRVASYGDFDLIFLDMAFDNFDGYDILRSLKKDLRTKKVPVFVFSNSQSEQDISHALRLGAEKYFVKKKTKTGEVIKEINKIFKK